MVAVNHLQLDLWGYTVMYGNEFSLIIQSCHLEMTEPTLLVQQNEVAAMANHVVHQIIWRESYDHLWIMREQTPCFYQRLDQKNQMLLN